MALSPTTCSFVQMGTDGKTTWKEMKHHLDDLGHSLNDGKLRTT
jgi:hypothetical protein